MSPHMCGKCSVEGDAAGMAAAVRYVTDCAVAVASGEVLREDVKFKDTWAGG